MNKIIILFLFLTTLLGCTNEVINEIIEKPESQQENLPPSNFNIYIDNITDTELTLSSSTPNDPEKKPILFDIALNDSVIDYELSEINHYKISNLRPEKEYLVSVIAYDSDYNRTIITEKCKTLKSFFQLILPINLNYYNQSIFKAIKTYENSYLICGIGTLDKISKAKVNFVAKINTDLSIAWKKEFKWDLNGWDMLAKETKNNNYYVGWNKTIKKLDNLGNEKWTYVCEKEYNIEFLTSFTESNGGNLLISGYSLDNTKDGVQYSILNISSDGELIWCKQGGNHLNNRANFITTTIDENILLFGTATFNSRDSYWFAKMDNSGNILAEFAYPNQYEGDDVTHSLEITYDGNYLLMGSAHGNINGYGYMDFIPHFIKIKPNGEIIWTKDHYLQSGGDGSFPVLAAYDRTMNNDFILAINDHAGSSIAEMNKEGEITNHYKLHYYPRVHLIDHKIQNEYIIISDEWLFVIDTKGYLGN